MTQSMRDPSTLSPIHRLGAGIKLLALAVAGTGLMLLGEWWELAVVLVVTLALYRVAGLSMQQAYRQIKPLQWLLVIIFVVQGVWQSWDLAALVVLRIGTLVLLAMLVTLTTRTDAMIAVIEWALEPFRRFGVDPGKVGLAFSLALRFIPVIGGQAQEIRDAQRARGLGSNPIALALPLALRTLRMAGDVADAIEARSPYDDGDDDDELPLRFVDMATNNQSRKTCTDKEPPHEISSTSRSSPL